MCIPNDEDADPAVTDCNQPFQPTRKEAVDSPKSTIVIGPAKPERTPNRSRFRPVNHLGDGQLLGAGSPENLAAIHSSWSRKDP